MSPIENLIAAINDSFVAIARQEWRMGKTGDLWVEVWESLKEELGRDPTSEEIRIAYADKLSSVVEFKPYEEDDEEKKPQN